MEGSLALDGIATSAPYNYSTLDPKSMEERGIGQEFNSLLETNDILQLRIYEAVENETNHTALTSAFSALNSYFNSQHTVTSAAALIPFNRKGSILAPIRHCIHPTQNGQII